MAKVLWSATRLKRCMTCGRHGLPSGSRPPPPPLLPSVDGGGGGGELMAAMMRGIFMMGTFCQASALGRSGSRPMVSTCLAT